MLACCQHDTDNEDTDLRNLRNLAEQYIGVVVDSEARSL